MDDEPSPFHPFAAGASQMEEQPKSSLSDQGLGTAPQQQQQQLHQQQHQHHQHQHNRHQSAAASKLSSASPSTPSTASSTPTLTKRPSHSSILAGAAKKLSSSTTPSPKPSRESSPIRPAPKAAPSARPAAARPTRTSKDVSPARSSSGSTALPPSAHTPAALTLTNIPQLPHSQSDPNVRHPVPQKANSTTEPREAPRWPISPRLRSPPPINKPVSAPRKPDQELPSINVHRSTPILSSERQDSVSIDSRVEEALENLGAKTAGRGVSGTASTLETVEEHTQSDSSALATQDVQEKREEGLQKAAEQGGSVEYPSSKAMEKSNKPTTESGSDSGGAKYEKGEIKLRATSATPAPSLRPNNVPPVKSYSTSGAVGRGKPSAEGSTKNMTVETETVSSIPQVAVGGGTGGPGINGSLRAKPSSETIRPKKEKKKTTRKAPSVASGMASSKADIFEAKIASAVDEANSSDSEETFVYESNPPEPSNHLRRYHSRTPSATSMASQAERSNQRATLGIENQHSVAPKKSMKFSNAYSANGLETLNGDDDGRGTGRSNVGTGRGTTHHHHIGRWGRNGGNGHQSLFDNESPFPNVAKAKLGANGSRQSSRPNSPKVAKFTNGKRSPASATYDIDDGAGADDERTPLIGSGVRSLRSGRHRRPGSASARHHERQIGFEEQSVLSRFSGCLILLMALILVVGGAFGFMYATTQPLSDVHVSALKNVLVSQQELMLDMEVMARNPNVVVVTIDSMNIEVFARSKHADDWNWWRVLDPPTAMKRVKRTANALVARGGNDPEDGEPDETETLKLGQLLEFDSPLTFEGSPFAYTPSKAVGGVRLANPGNTTESGGADGMEKWAQVLKYEFDLRIKGILEYQLPLSQRTRKSSVDFTTRVKPSKSTGPDDGSAKGKLHFEAVV